jgi:hypothetical protein
MIFQSPVFPGLETRFIEQKMKRLPIIENLITIMNDI